MSSRNKPDKREYIGTILAIAGFVAAVVAAVVAWPAFSHIFSNLFG